MRHGQRGYYAEQRLQIPSGNASLVSLFAMQFQELTIPIGWKVSIRWVQYLITCPKYLETFFKNGTLFFSEFLLNHLHSNHKHRRFNGDNLDLTMVVPQVEIITELKRSQTKIDLSLANGSSPHPGPTHSTQLTTQTWPFVEIFAHKRYFYLEAQSFSIDGHPEIFLWLWFLGNKNIKYYWMQSLDRLMTHLCQVIVHFW